MRNGRKESIGSIEFLLLAHLWLLPVARIIDHCSSLGAGINQTLLVLDLMQNYTFETVLA
jgi:hypothetical protein